MARRVVVICEDLTEPRGDGVKTFTAALAAALAHEYDTRLLTINGGSLGTKHRAAIRDADPDAVVYVPAESCTVSSFWRCFALRHFHRPALLGMVALCRVRHHAIARPLIQGTQPDLTFVCSYHSLLYMNRIGVSSELVTAGVDAARFRPPVERENERELLRQRYGVASDAYVYLYVGNLAHGRDLEVLAAIAAGGGNEMILVDDPGTPDEPVLRTALEAGGVRVVRDDVPVEEFYRLADCYLFPSIETARRVETPLTVLEALASGLPVLARPFGGLRDFLPPGDDLRYWDDEEQLARAAAALRAGPRPRTRNMGGFAWARVAERILFALEQTAS